MSTGLPVSVIVLTLNEEANIGDCLASVAAWAGDIVVVDSGSTDRTIEIAQRYTERVISHPFENYARQRNWASVEIPLAYEWILHLDADERITPELATSIARFFANGTHQTVDGAMISRRTVFMGRPILHGGHYPVYHLRLLRRNRSRCEDRLYDQHFLVDGTTTRLNGDMIDVITSDLVIWTQRHARWAALEAREQLEATTGTLGPTRQLVAPSLRGTPIERRRWLRTSYGHMPLFVRAFGYFFVRYVLRLGFLDGVEGLIFHFLQGCWYRFLIDARIYEMRKIRHPAPVIGPSPEIGA
jgi:glycosyltransferase involved in cell wall biosynthesis